VILEISHSTQIRYATPVLRSANIVRLAPAEGPAQHRLAFSLAVDPDATVGTYQDHWDNEIHHFSMNVIHTTLGITARSHVLTAPRPAPVEPVGWEAYLPEALGALLDFALPTPMTQLGQFAPDRRAGEDAWAWVRRQVERMPSRLSYRKGVTRVDTPAAAVLEAGVGVCQDFSHVLLGFLRSQGIPARYVSGYQYLGPEGRHEPHAWVDVWHPLHGWVGFDPAAGRPVDERYVKVALGRDYQEAAPVRGTVTYVVPVLDLAGAEVQEVEVKMRLVAEDPSDPSQATAWAEQPGRHSGET